MKYVFLMCIALFSHSFSSERIDYTVRENNYFFSTQYEIDSDTACPAIVQKSRIRRQYYLYDDTGAYRALGSKRLLCLGALFTWGTEIDVYDPDGTYIGFIDGQAGTAASAKFSLYEGNTLVGIAYLDRGSLGFTIYDPENGVKRIARLRRDFVQNVVDEWRVNIYDPEAIDIRLLHIFSAFAVDSQDAFREDT